MAYSYVRLVNFYGTNSKMINRFTFLRDSLCVIYVLLSRLLKNANLPAVSPEFIFLNLIDKVRYAVAEYRYYWQDL